jgi:FlaA1/EpsC-like NDP-sugar epimerase
MSATGRPIGDVLDVRERRTITWAQNAYVGWTMTLLMYIVILNLFVKYVDAVVIDSFTISIFTSVVLLAMLVTILGLEHRVHAFFDARKGTAWRIGSTIATLGILFLSEFVILEVIDIVFGEHVDLGGFVEIIIIVITLILAQKGGVYVWRKLGDPTAGAKAEIISE